MDEITMQLISKRGMTTDYFIDKMNEMDCHVEFSKNKFSNAKRIRTSWIGPDDQLKQYQIELSQDMLNSESFVDAYAHALAEIYMYIKKFKDGDNNTVDKGPDKH